MSSHFNLHYSYKRVTYKKLGTKRVDERKNLMATSEELTKELFSFSKMNSMSSGTESVTHFAAFWAL